MRISRRRFLELLRDFVVSFLVFFGLTKVGQAQTSEGVVRPPGAVDEEHFLAGCNRCGLCVDACGGRTGVLRTMTILEGWQNAGTPRFDCPESYCQRCMDCVQNCPTGVLRKVPSNELGIGVAEIRLRDCMINKGQACLRCVVDCTRGAVGQQNGLPVIDRPKCDGCGICAVHCPPKVISIKADPKQRQRWA